MLKTKIVCTVGPSCCEEGVLLRMVEAGMAVARLNFSHGEHDKHAEAIACLRGISEKLQQPLAIVQDLSGPKVRIGSIPGGAITLNLGDRLVLTSRAGTLGTGEVSLPFPSLIAAVDVGKCVLLDDGTIQLQVEEANGADLICRTVVPGVLSSHKGVNVPGVSFPISSLTAKDLEDLRFGLAQGVDWIAMSFVRTVDDIRRLRTAIQAEGASRPIIAKIERHEAVENLESIIHEADGVMVARGDLGVELPLERVPLVQKKIIRIANSLGKPVITATQMLESMIHNPRPTRAEVTDVCNAILDGTDAVMLSAETAAGSYPVESVKVMADVARRTEVSLAHQEIRRARAVETGTGISDAISEATNDIAARLDAAAVICATSTGGTARLMARFRPQAPVVAATTHRSTYNRLALSWGVMPVLVPASRTFDGMVDNAIEAALARGIVKDGDLVAVTAGSAIEVAGSTNVIKVQVVGQEDHIAGER